MVYRICIFYMLITLFVIVTSFKFIDPEQDGVDFSDQTLTSQKIYVNESNKEGRVKFVLITEVHGELVIPESPNLSLLGLDKEHNGEGQYYLSIKLFDYEAMVASNVNTNFAIDVIENNDITTKQSISLSIRNVDDESPIFWGKDCAINEETTITVNESPCVFQINDPDGFLSKMVFTITTSSEVDIFEFQYKEEPSDSMYASDIFLILKENATLDYEQTALHLLQVEAKDSAEHVTTVPIVVQVIDIPDQTPIWSSFVQFVTIDEEQEMTIKVSAQDGDFGINNEINYKLKALSESNTVSIDEKTGVISIGVIDRDQNDLNQIELEVTAFEVPDDTSYITGNITVFIEDIDDHIPEISLATNEKEITLQVDEDSTELNHPEIYISDIDLGENAVYDIKLISNGSEDYTDAFSVTASRGFENTTVYLTVTKPSKLDYENRDWKIITMELQTIGVKTPENNDSLPITILLKDINDEYPSFGNKSYEFEIPENVTPGYEIKEPIVADDKDDVDKGKLKYEIVEECTYNTFSIDETGGFLKVIKEHAFDYEQSKEVTVEIRVTDTAEHSSTAVVKITVLDVDDVKPTLELNVLDVSIDENPENGFVFPVDIHATDPDTLANLEFSIDIQNSNATKDGNKVNISSLKTCLNVEPLEGESNNEVSGKLTINNSNDENCMDFEVFDTLILQLLVTDTNTEENEDSDSKQLTIHINGINDNKPDFPDINNQSFEIEDNSQEGTTVNTVVAIDLDGDIVSYSMQSEDGAHDWFVIDASSGVITVKKGETIDCDAEKITGLNYSIIASDGENENNVTITVNIIDVNDNSPQLGDHPVAIEENSNNGTMVLKLNPVDLDRDSPFNTVECVFHQTASKDVTNNFVIVDNQIIVANQANLDREETPEFIFKLDCYDNPSNLDAISNHVSPPPTITIVLKDLNDNKPNIINTVLSGISENTIKGYITEKLEGEDPDEGDNGRINFVKIKQIKRYLNKDDPSTEKTGIPQDLFTVETLADNRRGLLKLTKENLKDLYGDLVVTISLEDLGDPVQKNEVDVTVEVSKVSSQRPKFNFPEDYNTIYLAPTQEEFTTLLKPSGQPITMFKATDQQDNKFGIKFEIVDDQNNGLFTLKDNHNSTAELQITTQDFPREKYTVTVRATLTDGTNNDIISDNNVPLFKDCIFFVDFY